MSALPESKLQERFWSIAEESGKLKLLLLGSWRIGFLKEISLSLPEEHAAARLVEIDGQKLEVLDTAGALQLIKLLRALAPEAELSFINWRKEFRSIFDLVHERALPHESLRHTEHFGVFEHAGRTAVAVWRGIVELLSFIGETISAFWHALLNPRRFRLRELVVQLEAGLVDAIPIASLVTFLIGIVIAYLFASQMERYGANIFIVDGVSIAMCRELSPLIVAIIVAGRSGSAFTAQIGTMKLNEEIDALHTLGLSPMQVLVIPRILALVIAMPLLVFVGDVVGTMGGLLIADSYLNVSPNTFIERLHSVFKLKHFWVGMVKAPVFAAFIAIIGCKMGLTVENNARSVGIHTTSTVVQSIVSVILLNAAFAVIFVELKI